MNKPDAILTSDWHLRVDAPISRIDDFWTAQWKKIIFISELQKKYDCPVFHAGDLFNKWKPSPYLLSCVINHIPEKFYTLYGNHDLPQHNLLLKDKTGIYTLEMAGSLQVFKTCHWDKTPSEPSIVIKGRKILLWHYFTYQSGNKKNYMSDVGKTSNLLLRKYKQFDLIVTGDNHQSFVEELNGRLLVNPGSMMRISAIQKDFQPKIYFYYADNNSVVSVDIPIEKNVMNTEHLEIQKEKDIRIQAFIKSFQEGGLETISFEDNLRLFFSRNKVINEVKEIILKSIE